MDWFAFSIAGAACLAVTGIIDKFYLGRYVRNTLAYLFVLVVIQQVFLLPVLFGGKKSFEILAERFGKPDVFHVFRQEHMAKPLPRQCIELHAIPEV